MTTSAEDSVKGSFHEAKGTIKEKLGKFTDDCGLEAEGNVEKNAGKIQQGIGHAKEIIEQLKGTLTAVTKDGNES
jgi:uncharacterized protein YjbJ (UPF0337 family)